MKQWISRRFELDIGHRVMDERFKCASMHGHRVAVTLNFSFCQMKEIGYCIDFKEIKRIAGQWLEDQLDHGFIVNPKDTAVITACQATRSKLYRMSIAGRNQYCNPTAENVAKEIFLAVEYLFLSFADLNLESVTYDETPNCQVSANTLSVTADELSAFLAQNQTQLDALLQAKPWLEYDQRHIEVAYI